MGFLSTPKGFIVEEFQKYVSELEWKQWKPAFITIHNTAEPSLKQWNDGFYKRDTHLDNYEAWRIGNLNSYYRSLGWRSGPHLFISPNKIWVACDLLSPGVSVSCWNRTTIGIEMVGDYASEDFDSGDGALVRDMTIDALVILHTALQITPLPYSVGKQGLHAHKACGRDNHDCPGKNVDMGLMRKMVMEKLGASPSE